MTRVLAAALLLAGCGGSDDVGSTNAGRTSGEAITLQPGLYAITQTARSVDLSGGITDSAKEQLGSGIRDGMSSERSEICLSTADISTGLPGIVEQGAGCEATRSTFAGGKIDIAYQCSEGAGPQGTTEVNGTHATTSFSGELTRTSPLSMFSDATMKWQITGTRLGDCAAKAATD